MKCPDQVIVISSPAATRADLTKKRVIKPLRDQQSGESYGLTAYEIDAVDPVANANNFRERITREFCGEKALIIAAGGDSTATMGVNLVEMLVGSDVDATLALAPTGHKSDGPNTIGTFWPDETSIDDLVEQDLRPLEVRINDGLMTYAAAHLTLEFPALVSTLLDDPYVRAIRRKFTDTKIDDIAIGAVISLASMTKMLVDHGRTLPRFSRNGDLPQKFDSVTFSIAETCGGILTFPNSLENLGPDSEGFNVSLKRLYDAVQLPNMGGEVSDEESLVFSRPISSLILAVDGMATNVHDAKKLSVRRGSAIKVAVPGKC